MRAAFPVLVALAVLACDGKRHEPVPAARRADTVKQTRARGPVRDPSGFCEKAYPASGEKARRFVWPALRPLPGQEAVAPPRLNGRWTWVNLWATWCVPCVAEMALLSRWSKAMEKEGAGVRLELLSIDSPDDATALQAKIAAGLPGEVRWLKGDGDRDALLDALGVSRDTAIPIHVLVDPVGQIRCVRVGAIHGPDYAAVRGILSGG